MLPAHPRVRRNTASLGRELRLSFREIDTRSLAPRVAGAAYLAGGLLTLIVALLLPDLRTQVNLVTISIVSTIFGAVCLVLPWHRWNVQAQLAVPAFAFVLFAWGGIVADQGWSGPYLAMLPLPFVFVGFTQRPGTSTLLAPAAAVSLLVANRFQVDGTLVATLLFALPMSVFVGEALALAQQRRTRAEDRVARLLEAVRTLSRVTDARRGADLVASLFAELLGAEAVAVLLSEPANKRRFLNRAYFGHPALREAAPLLIDALGTERAFTTGRTSFVVEPSRIQQLAHAARCVRALAIVPLPGDEAPLGVVIAMWASNRRRLPASARQAAELLSEEAGRMFQRLDDRAALTRDAETDPLTELANRRTFSRALSTMQPGDALLIVDLDHFKRVNDRYGHQAGDAALRSLAACLRDTARQVDCVARYGGEEFALILPEAGAVGAYALLQRVRETWQAERPLTTFSSGIAVHEEGIEPRETLSRADAALYEAKENGRNRDEFAPESVIDIALP
jgi:diguanylate cyclase (GGDEF)-like protein